MSPATHGWWCHAKTYPTVCRRCHRAGFFFSCECGSAVFFDNLGEPWPIHECGWTPPLWLGFRRTPGRPQLDPEYARRVTVRGRGDEWQINIVRMLPLDDAPLLACGLVREICEAADPASALELREIGSLGKSLLKEAGLSRVGQITVHMENSKDGTFESYTAFIARDRLEQLRPKRGDLVGVKLSPRSVMGRGPTWVVEELAYL